MTTELKPGTGQVFEPFDSGEPPRNRKPLALLLLILAWLALTCFAMFWALCGPVGADEAGFTAWVENAVACAETDEGRCIKLAREIAGSIRNGYTHPIDESESWMQSWGTRTGLCRRRAEIMIEALKRQNIRARRVILWADQPGQHSAVEAFYKGGWHFYDPTYGGYFLDATSHVCSWADIEARKAVRMVEWERTLDTVNADGRRANAHERMMTNYGRYLP